MNKFNFYQFFNDINEQLTLNKTLVNKLKKTSEKIKNCNKKKK